MSRLDLNALKAAPFSDLIQIARGLGIGNPSASPRQELIFAVLHANSQGGDPVCGGGVLEILPDGFGFLRDPDNNYQPGPYDIYVSPAQIRRFDLRTGDQVTGEIRAPRGSEKYFALLKVEAVNASDPDAETRQSRSFDSLTPVYPDEPLRLEHDPADAATRLIDLFAPLGMGQRCLVLAPPRSDRGAFLRAVARAVEANHPEAHLISLLLDARPEVVTEASRATARGEVISSTFDEQPSRHLQSAEMVLDRACRLVEQGRDVVVLVDSLTGLARACLNAATASPGRTLPSGYDASATQRVKRLLAAARKAEEGGSLTVIAAARCCTDSRLDLDILEDLRGVSNHEIHLCVPSPGVASPAVDPSGLYSRGAPAWRSDADAARISALIRALKGEPASDLEWLQGLFDRWPSNRELLESLETTDRAAAT
jgi:transcription termination factor Rho